jgi:ubiquinone/menaquinone biosynthesis C-methylase UbiE
VVALTARERTFKRKLLEHARLSPEDRVLDVGCGTGTLAIAAAPRAGEVVGLDADPEVLARARAKAAKAGLEIQFDEGYSTELPYPDDRFDVALSTLFFHHLKDADKERTARELRRVLAPGGRLVVGDLGRPHDPFMRAAVASVQLVDGRETTSLNVAGKLPALLGATVADRLRTPIGTIEILVG